MQALHADFTGIGVINPRVVAWGGDDDSLMGNFNKQQALVRRTFADATFKIITRATVYFELNQENF